MRPLLGILIISLLFVTSCGDELSEGELNEEAQAVPAAYLEVYTSGKGLPPEGMTSGPQRRLMAERAARIQALLAALREAGKDEELLKAESARIETSGYIRSYEVVEKKLNPDDSVVVRLRVLVVQ
jgi:hypothetical protein